jgi:hypothetical protein
LTSDVEADEGKAAAGKASRPAITAIVRHVRSLKFTPMI